MDPQPLANVGLGLSMTIVAAALNGGVALVILRAGRRLRSITLQADAHHLLTDVWTSLGVVLGIVTVQLTGWLVLDPLIGLLVAANIVRIGIGLLRDTAHGLLDRALPPGTRQGSPTSPRATRRKASGSTPCARGGLWAAPLYLDARPRAGPVDGATGPRPLGEDREGPR
jgi:hypothetical protein